jgi:hypothetical protein
MEITITGSSGYLGKDLITSLTKEDNKINLLLRKKSNQHYWNPEKNIMHQNLIDNSEIVINLNGARIIKPFARIKTSEIISSRMNPTKTLIDAIKNSKNPPKLIISASACGFYGNRPNELIDERSPKGRGEIPNIVNNWESIQKLEKTRVVFLRFGTIIDKNSEMYKYMKRFSSIVGISSIGSGENYFPWISKIDAIRSIHHVINNKNIEGPINVVSNTPITFKEVISEINAELKPIIRLKIPRVAISFLFGKFGKEILLPNQKVLPRKLKDSGFNWMNSTPSGSINLTP